MRKKCWPGKYTFILKRKTSEKIYGSDKKTIALRVPDFNPLNLLLKKSGKIIAQTSVNISDKPSMTKIKDIIEEFGEEKILIIDGGNLKSKKSSKVLDLTKNNIETIRQ